ncbi:MAG TPA: hypothetical protein VLV83_03560 [Acidobacteriota bacterium]|nr:hypothetical protein [Acidobacteriota bacterium]
MKTQESIPENHPVRKVFRNLTDRALNQSEMADNDLCLYLSDLLLHFMWSENLYGLKDEEGRPLYYLVDMYEELSKLPRRTRKDSYRQIGDYTLFILGMFPESLSYGRRQIPQSYYSDFGRRSYMAASELEGDTEAIATLRKLAHKYERCVLSLNWVREYSTDPFYQYMFRQFGIT